MTGRHRRLAAVPEPTPQALSAAVAAAVDAAQAVVDGRAGFEESVLAVFSHAVRRLDDDRLMVGWRADPEVALPAVAAAATAALPVVVSDIAKRLDVLAATSRVELDDSGSLAEMLVRLAHALLLVPDAALGGQTELHVYVQRHVTPMVRCAIDVEADGSGERGPTRRRRRVRTDLVAATLIAVLVGAAGWMAVVPRSAQPAVSPSNMSGTIPEPQEQRSPEAPAQPLPEQSPIPSSPPVPDAPFGEAAEPSTWTPVLAAPPPSRPLVTAQPGASRGSDGPASRPTMAGPHMGYPTPGGPPSGPTVSAFGPAGDGSARPPMTPSAPSGAGASKPDSRPGGGHPDAHG